MKRVLGFLTYLFTIFIVLAGAAFFYGFTAWQGPGPLTAEKDIVITRGVSVADQLSESGVIRSRLAFKAAARLTDQQTRIKAGEYLFPAHISTKDVLDKMVKGDVVQRKVAVPEGLTSWQIVQIVNKADAMNGTVTDVPKEGSLLPDTYPYTRDDPRSKIIADMGAAMTKYLAEAWPKRADNLPFTTPEQAITLASIVEKETGVAAERPRIAGVFINRLRQNMPLQTDPTVIYALTKGEIQDNGQGPLGRHLLKKDLDETDSPYNTYKYPGLPPGPIANPGKASIDAVLHPETNDFLYFVANGTGGHVFAATLAEHEANAAKWHVIRKEQGN